MIGRIERVALHDPGRIATSLAAIEAKTAIWILAEPRPEQLPGVDHPTRLPAAIRKLQQYLASLRVQHDSEALADYLIERFA